MAGSIFLKIPDVDGESTHKGYDKYFQMMSFSAGAHHPHTVESGTSGPGSGRTSFSDIHFTIRNQKNSNTLLHHLCTGKVYGTGVEVVFVVESGPDTHIEHVKYKFDEVMLTSWQLGGMDGEGIPTESWSFGFAKIEGESKIQTSEGVAESGAIMEYDLRTT